MGYNCPIVMILGTIVKWCVLIFEMVYKCYGVLDTHNSAKTEITTMSKYMGWARHVMHGYEELDYELFVSMYKNFSHQSKYLFIRQKCKCSR